MVLRGAASALSCVMLLVAGCGDDRETTTTTDPDPPQPIDCVAGELPLEDGACLPAGLPPDLGPCAAGETLETDGSCRPAGVPSCGTGFEADGDGGCIAVLPPSCPDGLMAVPGDARCRAVAACPASPWGAAPPAADTQYVDGSYAAGGSDGSATKPWTTIQAAIDAAAPNAVVAIAAGTYSEALLIAREPVVLWGRCPASVTIAAPSGSAVRIFAGVQGVEIHDLAITGSFVGVKVGSNASAGLERVWVHDTGERGVDAASNATLTVQGALFERTRLAAVYSSGAHAVIEASEVRGTLPLSGVGGRGIYVEASAAVRPEVTVHRSTVHDTLEAAITVIGADVHVDESVLRATSGGAALSGVALFATDDLGEPSNVTVDASLIEQSIYQGVAVRGSSLTISSSVVRSTEAGPEGQGGWGLTADEGLTPAHVTVSSSLFEGHAGTALLARASDLSVDSTIVRLGAEHDATAPAAGILVDGFAGGDPDAKLSVRGSVIDRVRDVGIAVFAATASIETTVVRDTQQGPGGGAGILVSEHLDSDAPSSATVSSSLLERNLEFGIGVFGSEVHIESTAVRGTTPKAGDRGGWGVVLAHRTHPARATVRSCAIAHNQRIGLAAMSSEAVIEATLIDDTLAAAEGSGVGLYAASFPEVGVPSTLTLVGSIVDRSVATGIQVVDSSVVVGLTEVAGTVSRPDGAFGDGVVMLQLALPTTMKLTGALVSDNARVGIAAHSGALELAQTRLDCNAIDLATANVGEGVASFHDLGGNVCGCSDVSEPCAVESADLAVPELPSDPPREPGSR